MANFRTHLNVALTASTALSTLGFLGKLYGVGTAICCVLIGTVGGLLPDIDLDASKPAKKGFLLVSLFVATLMAILYTTRNTGADVVIQALMLWVGAFCLLRFGLCEIFSCLTVHRGVVHSVPYMAIFALLVVYGAFWGLKLTAFVSWVFGIFLMFGAMVHLLLDEIYSVNVMGLKLKKSAGTAFKFFEKKKKWSYLTLYVMILVLVVFAPDYHDVWWRIKRAIISFLN